MLQTYRYPEYAYVQSHEQKSGLPRRHPVVIIGAGPIGLTAALECARRGLPVVVVDDNNTVSVGSRAVCYAKRPLEIWDRLGVGERMVEKGVNWKIGKVYFKDDLVYSFDLLPEQGYKMPAMINLQQYYLEEYLVEAAYDDDQIDLRWKHRLISLSQADDHAALVIDGRAPETLVDTYHEERAFAADDNLLNSTRSTDFITPKSNASRVLRNAVLQLAEKQPFARQLVNSGRLSTPTPYSTSSLNTPDEDVFDGAMMPGTNCADAPVVSSR